MTDLFKALNDPTRRRILELLRREPLTAGELADRCSVAKPTLSHHLDLLLRAELVEQERIGSFRRYHLNTSVVEDVMVWLGSLLGGGAAAADLASASDADADAASSPADAMTTGSKTKLPCPGLRCQSSNRNNHHEFQRQNARLFPQGVVSTGSGPGADVGGPGGLAVRVPPGADAVGA